MFKPIDQLLRVRKVIHVARECHMVVLMCLLAFLLSCGNDTDTSGNHGAEAGVLRVHPSNPRWLTNDSGKAIYLSGLSGGWSYNPPTLWYHNMYYPAPAFGCVQDVIGSPTPVVNDYAQAFANLASAGLNSHALLDLDHQTFWGMTRKSPPG